MINTTGSTHPALDKITRITPTRCVKQPGRLGRGRAQIIQLWALWVG